MSESARPHHWGRLTSDDKTYALYVTDWCDNCGTLRGQEFEKEYGSAAQMAKTTRYRQPGGGWIPNEPECKPWPVAPVFTNERDVKLKATHAYSPSYAGLDVHDLPVARCLADCPDGKRRRITVRVSPQVLLDWGIANLPYPARLITGNGEDNVGVWVESEEWK
jgi:hypothetical protein